MNVGFINKQSWELCSTLLLPEVATAMKNGEAVTALGLVEEDCCCGALAGYVEDGVFHIASLYVAPAYRLRGGGRLLLETLIKGLVNCDGVTDVDIDFVTTEPEHESLAPFLEAMGFGAEIDSVHNIYLTTLGQVAEQDFFKREWKTSPHIHALSSMSEIDLHVLERKMFQLEVPLPPGRLYGETLEREISMIYESHRGEDISSMMLFEHPKSGRLHLTSVWSAAPTTMAALLMTVFHKTMELYSPETQLTVEPVNQQSYDVLARLIPTARPISYHYARSLYLL